METERKKVYERYALVIAWICACALILFYAARIHDHDRVRINDAVIRVDVVMHTAEQARGLSGRDGLCEKCGMLFVYSEEKVRTFWMKDMLFDIDVVWINGDDIVGVQEAISFKKNANAQFSSPESVDKVLELPRGYVAKNSIKIGQKVELLRKW